MSEPWAARLIGRILLRATALQCSPGNLAYPPARITQRILPVIGLLDDGLPAEFLTGDRVLKSRFSKY
jgi:hypothetical protein